MPRSEPAWIAIDEAFSRLKTAIGSEQLASHTLFTALKSGTVKSIGRQLKGETAYIDKSTAIKDYDLNKEIWNDAKISKTQGYSGKLFIRIPQLFMQGGSWAIFVDRSDIDRVISPDANKFVKSEDNKGGAPEKHNWAAAFAYCGWYVAANGLPSEKAKLVELVETWFKDVDGGVPKGDRELRRRVSQAYDELSRLGALTRDGFKPSSDP